MHSKEGRLTRWDFPKLGYSAVRPSTCQLRLSQEGHVAVSTEASGYISFLESLSEVRFISCTFLLTEHTLVICSLIHSAHK